MFDLFGRILRVNDQLCCIQRLLSVTAVNAAVNAPHLVAVSVCVPFRPELTPPPLSLCIPTGGYLVTGHHRHRAGEGRAAQL